MGSLDLRDLASASQDESISRLTSTPTLTMFSSRDFFIDYPTRHVFAGPTGHHLVAYWLCTIPFSHPHKTWKSGLAARD